MNRAVLVPGVRVLGVALTGSAKTTGTGSNPGALALGALAVLGSLGSRRPLRHLRLSDLDQLSDFSHRYSPSIPIALPQITMRVSTFFVSLIVAVPTLARHACEPIAMQMPVCAVRYPSSSKTQVLRLPLVSENALTRPCLVQLAARRLRITSVCVRKAKARRWSRWSSLA